MRFARIALGLAVVLCVGVVRAALAAGPNIILVIGDDHGWPYYGFQESTFVLSNGAPVQAWAQTPHLDQLVESGVLFSRGYATDSLCVPSLQNLLSAHGFEYRQWLRMRAEVRDQIPLLPLERSQRLENRYLYSLPRALAREGYRTWEGGKYWAGTYRDAGFEEGLATDIGSPPYFKPGGSQFGREGWDVGSCGSTARTDAVCAALDPFREFLDASGEQPFFAWFAPQLPHIPYDAPQVYRTAFEAAGLLEAEVDHLANIRWFDELLGELLIELDRRALRKDTLLVYLSDNGWGIGLQDRAQSGRGKGTLYDIGFRSPIVFNQPGTVPPGVVVDDFVSFRDIPVTLLDYAGAAPLRDAEGESLRRRIHGGPALDREGLVLFSHLFGGAWVDRRWRYLQFDDGHEELYRIDLDPTEQLDLAAENPERVAAYRSRVDARRSEINSIPDRADLLLRLEDAVGAPVGGGTVRLRDTSGLPERAAVSDELGWLSFDRTLVASVSALRPGRGLSDRTPLAAGDEPQLPFSNPGLVSRLRVAPDRPVTGPFMGRLDGTVRDADGRAVQNAHLRLFTHLRGRNLSLATRSGADGTFQFENLVPSPRYRLLVRARGFAARRHSPVVIPPLGAGTTLEIGLDRR